MKYTINTDIYRNMFGMPADVADKYIKLASHSALKVLIYILRNGTEAIDDSVTFKLGITRTELDEALMYWHSVGVLCDGAESKQEESVSPADELTVTVMRKPDRAESARRISESTEIAQILRHAEQAFARTLKQTEISTFIYIVDSLMLTPPIVLMLIQYATEQGRLTASYIEATAVRWVNEGLTSVREVEKEIQRAADRRSAWGIVRSAFGIEDRRASKNEEQFSYTWVIDWQFTPVMLRKAYDECIDHSGKLSMPYINKILSNWHESGITTPEQAINNSAMRPEKRKPAKSSGESPSFDLNLFEQLMGGE